MSKVVEAEIRELLTKGANNRLRKSGKIPAIVYGHNAPVNIAINERDFHNNFKKISENEIINLTIGKASRSVLIKDYQRDYLKGSIKHIDFYEIEKGHKLRTHVPIHIVGIAPGTRDGGILENALHDLEIECVAEKLPEFIEVDVGELIVGHAIHVRDVKAPEGIRILNNLEQVVASVTHVREEVAPVVAEVVEAPVAAAAVPASATAKAAPAPKKE